MRDGARRRTGDDLAGFWFEFDDGARKLQVKAWGFWGPDVAVAFGKDLAEACREAPAGSTLDVDMIDLKPMREEGQLAFSTFVASLPSTGIVDVVIRTGPLTKLQLLRLIAERGAKKSVRIM